MTISLQSRKNRFLLLILCIIILFTLLFLIMDWGYGISDPSEIIKYVISCFCVIIVLVTGSDGLDKRDTSLLKIAFTFIFLADTFLVILNRFADPHQHKIFFLIGICCFIGFHIILIIRHSRNLKSIITKRERDRVIFSVKTGIIVCSLLIINIYIIVTSVREFVLLGIMIGYAIILTISLWTGWGTLKSGFFPRLNAWFIAIGLTIHFISDLCIALGSAFSQLSPITTPLIWTLYGPAIVLLALSGYKSLAVKRSPLPKDD
ncbi:MAG: hypothetical protein JXJ04_25745 [Spirochaetales bacterium]|nr:hypothetical protein [Spirochaetales bacterium]